MCAPDRQYIPAQLFRARHKDSSLFPTVRPLAKTLTVSQSAGNCQADSS
jgi:hypothetical protein